MVRRSLLGLLLPVIVVVAACGDGGGPAPTVLSVVIGPGDVEVTVGGTVTLTATVAVVGGASDAVVWSSDDDGVATVSDVGVVTGVSAGEAVIAATSAADGSVSDAITATVVVGQGDAATVTLLANVAPLPGSSADDLRFVSPLAESRVVSTSGAMRLSGASFVVPRDRVAVVGAVDIRREVGWTAVWPGWFEGVAIETSGMAAASTVSAVEEIGPLSTAVQMVFSLPGFYDTDLEAARSTIATLRGLPEVVALAVALESHAEAVDVLDVPAVELAFAAAVDAAAVALAEPATSATHSEVGVSGVPAGPSVARYLDLDVDLTRFYSGPGEGWLGWDPALGSLSRAVTWLGYVYEVDAGAFDDWEALRVFFDEDPWRSDVALVSTAPVGAMLLEPDTVFAYIDVFEVVAEYVTSFLPGIERERAVFKIPDRDAVYAVHVVTCAPHAANFVWSQNHQSDARLLLGWPGGPDAFAMACVTNVMEMALDAASLLVDTVFVAEAMAEGIVRGRLRALALDALDGDDDPFRISPQAWMRTQQVMVSAIYEEVANRVAEEGLKALLQFVIRQKTKLVDVPGAFASIGKVATRLGVLGVVTPWEGVVLQVGDPWQDQGVRVTVNPVSVTLPVSGSESFTATVSGTQDTSVSWSATCGTIPESGNPVTYTAPSTSGTCLVTVTSDADPSAHAAATVTVIGAEAFTDWHTVDTTANRAVGTLGAATVTFTGTSISFGVTDGSYTGFDRAYFTPPLTSTDYVAFEAYASPATYVLEFDVPVTDPVIHLLSLASTMTFEQGTVVRLSGQPSFSVSGNSVSGVISDGGFPNDSNGTVQLLGTFSSITFTATYSRTVDGIGIQVGLP